MELSITENGIYFHTKMITKKEKQNLLKIRSFLRFVLLRLSLAMPPWGYGSDVPENRFQINVPFTVLR